MVNNLKNVELLLSVEKEPGVYLILVERKDTFQPFIVAHYNEGEDEWYWGNYFSNVVTACKKYSEIAWGWDEKRFIEELTRGAIERKNKAWIKVLT